MLNYWELVAKFIEDPKKILERYCDELIEEIGKPKEKQDHFLLEARRKSSYDNWEYRNLAPKESQEREFSDFIEAIYSNDLETFIRYFFGSSISVEKTEESCWVFTTDTDAFDYDDYDHCAEEEIMHFFGEFSAPFETYIEKQILDGGHLPSRQVLTDKDKEWKTLEPVLTWDYTKL